MRRELWTVSGAMCEIYLQTKTLISSLGSDYKASDNGDGVRVECHRYIYHRIMDTIMSPGCALPANHGTDMFSVTGLRALFFWFHEMLLMSCDHQIDIWEARFERKPEHRVYNRRAEPEMGNFKRILLGGEWSIWPRNKISTSILLRSSGHQHVMGQESGLDVKRMSGWRVITGHYVNWDWQQHNI